MVKEMNEILFCPEPSPPNKEGWGNSNTLWFFHKLIRDMHKGISLLK